MTDVSGQVEELRGMANALRCLSKDQGNDVHSMNMAGKYLHKVLLLGAFGHPKWIRFRTHAEHWFSHDLPFVSASDWFKKNGPDMGLQVDASKGNADLNYWAPFVADLVEGDAAVIEAEDRAARETAARAPKNRWRAIHHWWQHNLYATIAVVIVGLISAIGGLIAFVREILMLLGEGS